MTQDYKWKLRSRNNIWNNRYPDSDLKIIRAHLSCEERGIINEVYIRKHSPQESEWKESDWTKVKLDSLLENESSFEKPREYWQHLFRQAKISLGLEPPEQTSKIRWRTRYSYESGFKRQYFDDLISALMTKLRYVERGHEAIVQVQIDDSPFIPEEQDCIEWLLSESERLGKPKRYWLKLIEEAEIRLGKVELQFEKAEIEDDGLPMFRLSDVPDDWEIELDDYFVTALDKVNRPWYYIEGKKKGANKIWPSNWKTVKDHNGQLFKLYRRLWGWHRYAKGRDSGAWIGKRQIPDLMILDCLTEEDIENAVIGIRKGPDSKRTNSLRSRLPIKPDKWWARLFGHYFSSGRVKPRFRQGRYVEVVFKLRGHEDVLPMLMETLDNIGDQAGVSAYDADRYALKRKGRFNGVRRSKVLGTTSQRTINVGRPVWLVMQKFGLSVDFLEDLERKGRTSSANISPRIPQWISDDDEFMHSFIEGYINGSKGQSMMHPAPRKHFLSCQVLIKAIGRPSESVQRFIATITDWFTGKGVTWYLREEPWWDDARRPNARYALHLMSHEALTFLVENFEIRRPDLRARLLLARDASIDPVLYEVLLSLRTPDNVILGIIYEQPRTREELSTIIQIREDRLTAGLIALQKRGIIERRGAHYAYEPTEFVNRFIRDRKNKAWMLTDKMNRYSVRLLNQCQQCSRIYINAKEECGLCGGEITPVPRNGIMKALSKQRVWELQLAHRVTVHAKRIPAVIHRFR